MNRKAQTSLEMILIALVIITIASSIVGVYNSINSSTIALGLAKTSTLSALNASQKNFIIERIGINTNAFHVEINIQVQSDETIGCTDIGAAETAQLIQGKGLYPAIAILLNGFPC